MLPLDPSLKGTAVLPEGQGLDKDATIRRKSRHKVQEQTGTEGLGNPVGSKEPLETRTHFACHVEWGELPTLSSLGSGMLVLLQDTKHFCTGRGCPVQNARGASAEEHWTPRWPGDSKRGRGWKGKLRLHYKDPISVPTLEKGMANYFSLLALRTPWTGRKGRKIGHWKMNSPGQWVPNRLLEKSGEITPERMKRQSQCKNNTQLWMWLVMEVKSDGIKRNSAQEPGMLGPWIKINWRWSNRRWQE